MEEAASMPETPVPKEDTSEKKKRTVRAPKPLEYAYPYSQWVDVIKPFYLSIADVTKLKDQCPLNLIILPKELPDIRPGVKMLKDRIYDAERFTKAYNLRCRIKKCSAPKGLTLNVMYQNRVRPLQVKGKHGRQLDDQFRDLTEDDGYGETELKWTELNRRSSYVGLHDCHLVDASRLLELPKIYLPNDDDMMDASEEGGSPDATETNTSE